MVSQMFLFKHDLRGGRTPITTFVNGVEIKFDVDHLCEILSIENVRMEIYESKSWSKVIGFSPAEAV